MPAGCRLLQTALIAACLSPTLVSTGLGQTGIKNGGTVIATAGSDTDLQWTYTLTPGITPLFQTWRKLPDTGIASKTSMVYISQAYQGRVELFGVSGLRLKNVTTADSGTYQLYVVSSDGTSQTLQLTLQVLAVPETTTDQPTTHAVTTMSPTTTTTTTVVTTLPTTAQTNKPITTTPDRPTTSIQGIQTLPPSTVTQATTQAPITITTQTPTQGTHGTTTLAGGVVTTTLPIGTVTTTTTPITTQTTTQIVTTQSTPRPTYTTFPTHGTTTTQTTTPTQIHTVTASVGTTTTQTATTTQSTTRPTQNTFPSHAPTTTTQAVTTTQSTTIPTQPTFPTPGTTTTQAVIATTTIPTQPTFPTHGTTTTQTTRPITTTPTQSTTRPPRPSTHSPTQTTTQGTTTTQAYITSQTTTRPTRPTTHSPTQTTTQGTTPTPVITTQLGTIATVTSTTTVATATTSPTTPAATTAPSTAQPVENDVYVPDDGITEVVEGGTARLDWTYSLRPGHIITCLEWYGPDENEIMRWVIGGFFYDNFNNEYENRLRRIGDSSLLLNGTRPPDAGNYSLRAFFSDITDHEVKRELIIHYAPMVPHIDVTPSPTIAEGDTVVLQATADSFPPATYTWGRLDGSLPDTAVLNATQGTLTITGISMADSGIYTVVAGNYLGNSSVTNVTLEVGPRPIPVAILAGPPPLEETVTVVTTEGLLITQPPVSAPGLLTTLETVLIALGTTLVVAILVAAALRYWWVRKRRGRAERQTGRWYFHPFILDRVYPAEIPPPPVPARPQFLKYELDRKDLELRQEIGRGAFGVVHLATLQRTPDGVLTNRTVVVKTVHDGASVEEKATFVREIETTINLGEHRNLLGLVGCCTLANPPYLVTEYLQHGDLKKFLLKCRQPLASVLNTVYDMTELKMYQIGRQIANGMVVISEAGYVHGDLAARNVLVGADLVVKIADFGLATDVYERGYQRQDAEQKIPLRWMAPERLLREGRYTSKSDVWSFGVVLYEIATLGDVPYPGLGANLLEELRRGRREQRPQGCPWELYNMMLSCWQWDEFSRPGFPQLFLELDRLVEANAEVSYLKLSAASSDSEKSSGIFTDSLASSNDSLDTPSTSETSQASQDLKETSQASQETSQASQDLKESAEAPQPPVEDGRRSNEAGDVTIGQAKGSGAAREQIQTNDCVSYKFPSRKNKSLENGRDNSDSSSAEIQFVEPRRSGRSWADRGKIGADSYVYYKVPPKNGHRKQRQGSGKVIDEDQIEVVDLDSDFIESEALYF